MKATVEAALKERWEKATEDKYLEICRTPQSIPELDVGAMRDSSCLLLGMRFWIVGSFKETTNVKLERLVREMGETILCRATAQLFLRKHSITPHCFILIQDRKQLDNALTGQNKPLMSFTCGDWKFLSWTYKKDVSIKKRVLDVKDYVFEGGANARTVRVNDVRPLMRLQMQPTALSTVSAISALKRHRSENDDLIQNLEKTAKTF